MAFIRSLLKSGAIALLATYGWVRLRLSRGPTLLILTYHRILPADAPERKAEQPGMLTSPAVLEKHIRFVRKLGAEPVHLQEWLERKAKNEDLPRLAVAFTFDDGWRDNYQYAYPKLKAQNIPAVIFLVTRMIDTNRTFWPEHVLRLLTAKAIRNGTTEYQWLIPFLPNGESTSAPLNLKDADEVITRLKSLTDESIYCHLDSIPTEPEGFEIAPDTRAILNSPEIIEMAQSGLVKFGAHTQNHYRLNRLTEASSLRSEIVGSLKDLRFLGDSAVPVFCYPNGNITGEGEDLVKQHYEAACTTKTGWNNSATTNPFELHRFNLHDGNSFSQLRFLAALGRGIL